MVGCLDLNILTFSISLVGSTIDSIWPAPLEIICFFFFLPSYTPLSLKHARQHYSQPLLFGPDSHTPSLWQIGIHTLRSLTNSLCPEVPTTSPPLQFLFYNFTPCVRIHWSFSCCALQLSAAVLICQLVFLATTIHSVQSSRNPSVDIGNNFYFIIFVRHSISASLPYLRLTHLRRLLRRTFDVRLGSRKKRTSISSHQVAAERCTLHRHGMDKVNSKVVPSPCQRGSILSAIRLQWPHSRSATTEQLPAETVRGQQRRRVAHQTQIDAGTDKTSYKITGLKEQGAIHN